MVGFVGEGHVSKGHSGTRAGRVLIGAGRIMIRTSRVLIGAGWKDWQFGGAKDLVA